MLLGEGRLENQALWGYIIVSFLLLGLLTGVGAVVNLVAKRRLFNGAAVCFWILLALVAALQVFVFTAARPSFELGVRVGEITGALTPALVVAFFLGRRFRRKARLARST